MVFLGLALIILGGIAILSAVFVSEPGSGGELLGFDVTTLESFFVGVAAGAAILWGFSILKWGTKRGLAQRKERKELNKLSERLPGRGLVVPMATGLVLAVWALHLRFLARAAKPEYLDDDDRIEILPL
jgi:hypothetical protein